MKIVRGEAWLIRLPMEEPYSIAYASTDTAENVLIRLVTDGPHVGYGCAAPDLDVTKETVGETFTRLKGWTAALAGSDTGDMAELLSRLRAESPRSTAALAAVDMALYDLKAREAGLPLWKFLGGNRPSIVTSITIGILSGKETVARARAWVGQGFTALKLKGGKDWQEDAERAVKVRDAVGPGVSIRFDANQGYDRRQTWRFLEAARRADVEFLEQPTPVTRPEWLGVFHAAPVPVMADESLFTGEDAERFAAKVPAFNIKLMKTGGIAGALPILSVAEKHKTKVMIGCMDESALGIAAGLALALGSKAVGYADLDGHIGLEGDPAEGAVILKDGKLFPKDAPGLGISL